MTSTGESTSGRYAVDRGPTSCSARLAAILNSGAKRIDEIDGIEELFDQFVLSREYEKSYLTALREMVEIGPSKTERTIGTAFTIFRNSNFLIVIQMLDATRFSGLEKQPDSLLATNPDNGLQSVISAKGGLAISRYALPEGADLSVFDPGARLRFIDETKLESASPCYRYHAGEVTKTLSSGTVCVIRLREANLMDYQWTFDSETLAAVFPSVTLPSVGRLETVIDLMVKFSGDRIEERESISFLSKMLDHRLHFIRWKAVQGLGEIDGDEALKALKTMIDDPHPHIRAAALEACQESCEASEV